MTSPATTNFFFFNQAANNVLGGQLTSYALYSPRTPGDQPGQSTPRYLSEWHSLPDGAFIPRGAFQNAALFHNVPGSPQTNDIPVDDVAGAVQLRMPYIAFDEQGRLHRHVGPLQLPVMEGSVSQLKESNGLTNLVVTTDAVETSLPVTTGQIVPGVIYLVGGPPGSQVRYPPAGTNFYSAGQTFTGLSIPAFTAIAGPDGPPRVVQYYGVMVDPLTGRARSVRPEIQ
jgi:hypothetical protein